jgi:hypothetical protein
MPLGKLQENMHIRKGVPLKRQGGTDSSDLKVHISYGQTPKE